MSETPWGGEWTEQKLRILSGYLEFYLQALKNFRFDLYYIDGFAGAGHRKVRSVEPIDLLWPAEIGENEVQEYRDGSARIALNLDPGFDRYVFIESDSRKCEVLSGLTPAYANAQVHVLQGEANIELQRLASASWRDRRGVAFLDPYGMQLDWATLQALALTQALDVWILVPIAIAPNRLLPKKLSNLEPSWGEKLDRWFGTIKWRTAFYESLNESDRRLGQASLFNNLEDDDYEQEQYKRISYDDIAQFFIEQLKTIFPHVADKYRLLYNSTQQPLYMLCFAAANPSPKAGALSLKVANHLLEKW